MKNLYAPAGAAIALALMAASPAMAKTLRVSAIIPESHYGIAQGFAPFTQCVQEATKGEIELQMFAASQIGGFYETLDVVNNGLVEISYLAPSALSDRMPLSAVPMLPGLGDSIAEMTAAYRQALESDTHLAKEFSDNRVHPLLINFLPPYQLFFKGNPPKSFAELQGKKVSVSGGAVLITATQMGLTPVEMATGDIYVAVQNGTIDGVFNSYASADVYKYYEVTKSFSKGPGYGAATGVFAIDTGIWESLSPEQQTILDDCGRKSEAALATWADEWVAGLEAELAGFGQEVFEFEADSLVLLDKAMEGARQEYVDRIDARKLPGSAFLEQYRDVLKKNAAN